jgi:hypothetical protein
MSLLTRKSKETDDATAEVCVLLRKGIATEQIEAKKRKLHIATPFNSTLSPKKHNRNYRNWTKRLGKTSSIAADAGRGISTSCQI